MPPSADTPRDIPAVSVVMPVRNGEAFLREAVDSVLGEALPDLELVVVDDGSTDETPAILAEYGGRDPRLRVHREEGDNLATALNRGFRLCRAPLFARLDSDDVCVSGRLQAQVQFMTAHPEVVLLGGQALLVNEAGEEFATAEYPLGDSDLRAALKTGNPFVHSAVAFSRKAFEAVGGYRQNLPHAEDLDLWLRLSEQGKLASLPRPLVKYRIHGDQLSLRKQEEQAVHAEAVRVSARARAEGRRDPLDGAGRIDEDFLLAEGVDRAEVTRAVVDAATWMARTTARAGYHEAAAQLFDVAYARARSDSGSPALTATVHRSIARRHAEQGHRLRAKLKSAQAAIAERR
jgi:glycosyltransferase involved in cell wall biosynthesis